MGGAAAVAGAEAEEGPQDAGGLRRFLGDVVSEACRRAIEAGGVEGCSAWVAQCGMLGRVSLGSSSSSSSSTSRTHANGTGGDLTPSISVLGWSFQTWWGAEVAVRVSTLQCVSSHNCGGGLLSPQGTVELRCSDEGTLRAVLADAESLLIGISGGIIRNFRLRDPSAAAAASSPPAGRAASSQTSHPSHLSVCPTLGLTPLTADIYRGLGFGVGFDSNAEAQAISSYSDISVTRDVNATAQAYCASVVKHFTHVASE